MERSTVLLSGGAGVVGVERVTVCSTTKIKVMVSVKKKKHWFMWTSEWVTLTNTLITFTVKQVRTTASLKLYYKIIFLFNIYVFTTIWETESHCSLLKLVLNTYKTKLMLFANTSESVANLPSILTSRGKEIELVQAISIWALLLIMS